MKSKVTDFDPKYFVFKNIRLELKLTCLTDFITEGILKPIKKIPLHEKKMLPLRIFFFISFKFLTSVCFQFANTHAKRGS